MFVCAHNMFYNLSSTLPEEKSIHEPVISTKYPLISTPYQNKRLISLYLITLAHKDFIFHQVKVGTSINQLKNV